MQRVSLIVCALLIVWSLYLGLDGDAFTYYLAISLFISGITGVVATFNAQRICRLICGEGGCQE